VIKKNKAILILYFLLGIIIIPKSALGFSCSNTMLVTDKNTYNNNENIYLNGSWELYYNSGFETSYVQIQITNIFDKILWNSSNYYTIGISQKNWTISIQFLNLTLTNYSHMIYIKLFNYYQNFNDVVATYREIITVNITKRDVDCDLIDYKSELVFGESNLFIAKFYSGNTSFCLVNETLQCSIKNNDEIIYQTNFTTDKDGLLLFNVSTVEHLRLGRNEISFIIKNNPYYLDTTFSYEISVKKIPVYVEITNFVNNIEEDSLIKIQLFYYYFNAGIKPLENENLKMIVYSNSTIEYEEMVKTNQTGFVNIDIFSSIFNFKEGDNIFYVDFIFNGTSYLENTTTALSFQIQIFQYDRNNNSFYFVNIFLLSILTSLFTVIGIKVYKYKKAGFKLIRDITFKF